VISDFKVLQLNYRDLLEKFAEISALIQDFKIICLQGTWLSHTNKLSFKNYCAFRGDRKDLRIGGCSMIICKKTLNPTLHKLESAVLSNCDITMISILDNNLY